MLPLCLFEFDPAFCLRAVVVVVTVRLGFSVLCAGSIRALMRDCLP